MENNSSSDPVALKDQLVAIATISAIAAVQKTLNVAKDAEGGISEETAISIAKEVYKNLYDSSLKAEQNKSSFGKSKKEKEDGNGNGMMVMLVLILLIGGGFWYYKKYYKVSTTAPPVTASAFGRMAKSVRKM